MKHSFSFTVLLAISAVVSSCATERQAHVQGNTIEWSKKHAPTMEQTAANAPPVTSASFEIASEQRATAPVVVVAEAPVTAQLQEPVVQVVRAEHASTTVRRVLSALQEKATLVVQSQPTVALPEEGAASMNTMAILGFVFSLLLPLLGLIFSLIALGQIKKSGERGHGLAMAGLIISIVTMLLIIVALA